MAAIGYKSYGDDLLVLVAGNINADLEDTEGTLRLEAIAEELAAAGCWVWVCTSSHGASRG